MPKIDADKPTLSVRDLYDAWELAEKMGAAKVIDEPRMHRIGRKIVSVLSRKI